MNLINKFNEKIILIEIKSKIAAVNEFHKQI